MPWERLDVDPSTLRLPWSRREGADPAKLARQIARHGDQMVGFPPPWVVRDKNGLLRLNDGVTRATRLAKLKPGQKIPVVVIEDMPSADFSQNPTVGEKLP